MPLAQLLHLLRPRLTQTVTGPGPVRIALDGRHGWFMWEITGAPGHHTLTLEGMAGDDPIDGGQFTREVGPSGQGKRLVRIPRGCRAVFLDSVEPVDRATRHRLVPLWEHRAVTVMGRKLAAGQRPAAMPIETLHLAYRRRFPPADPQAVYAGWIRWREPELLAASLPAAVPSPSPLIRVVVDGIGAEPTALATTLDSVRKQDWPGAEVVVVGAPCSGDWPTTWHWRTSATPGAAALAIGINDQTSGWALRLAAGDRLIPSALVRFAAAAVRHPQADLLYGDVDHWIDGQRRDPRFRPQFQRDFLLGMDWLSGPVLFSVPRLLAVGGIRDRGPAWHQELVLRLTRDRDPAHQVHLPGILAHVAPTSDLPAAAVAAVVQESLGTRATAMPGPRPGTCRIRWQLPVSSPIPSHRLRVSAIIPTRDGAVLDRCLDGLLRRTAWPDLEAIVVDNGSRLPETQTRLRRWSGDPRLRIVHDARPFNYAALNNAAARLATGEVLLLLNDDVEPDGDPQWLAELVAQTLRGDSGCVGPLLLYPGTRRIQHAGVTLGIGIASHGHRLMPAEHPGVDGRLSVAHEVSAVTGACLAVRREVFWSVGGLEEALAVAFNDVDLCLKIRARGLRNRFTPAAVLLHHESLTRGADLSPEKRRLLEWESAWMRHRWGAELDTDPSYHPYLSRTSTRFVPEW